MDKIKHTRNRKSISVSERFWKYVQKTDDNGCWIWTGKSKTCFGYGLINLGGHNGKIEKAHRVSWILAYGNIPDGLFVCHHCDNPPCVRPDHLFLGTPADNNHDMQQKGRCDRVKRPKGERHWMAKLTNEQVLEIRAKYESDKPYLRQLGVQYGVSLQTIHRIVRRKNWDHI